MTETKFQIGKNGLTEGVIDSLHLALKYHKRIRISVLKSANRNRDEMINLDNKIKSSLEKKYKGKYMSKIIGFTIILQRR
mgnify:CR=1 FL=1